MRKRRKFLSTKTLQIGRMDRAALIKVLRCLEAGKVHYVKSSEPASKPRKAPAQFNMALWFGKNECGSVCCIGGLAQVLGAKGLANRSIPRELDLLFFAPGHDLRAIKVKQAARAVANYLTKGGPDWDRVLR